MNKAEALYGESLNATICGSPGNDVLHEHYAGTHRHFNPEMYENLASLRFNRGQLAAAARAFKMATKDYGPIANGSTYSVFTNNTNLRAWKNLALTYGRLGNQEKLKETWIHIRQIAPNDPDVLKVFH